MTSRVLFLVSGTRVLTSSPVHLITPTKNGGLDPMRCHVSTGEIREIYVIHSGKSRNLPIHGYMGTYNFHKTTLGKIKGIIHIHEQGWT